MSAQTREALAAAIEDHLNDEYGAEVIGAWIVLAETGKLADLNTRHSELTTESHGSKFTLRGLTDVWREVNRWPRGHGPAEQ